MDVVWGRVTFACFFFSRDFFRPSAFTDRVTQARKKRDITFSLTYFLFNCSQSLVNNRLRLELKNKIRIREKKVPACLILTGSKPRNLIASSPFAMQNVPSPPDDNLVVFVEHPIHNEANASQTILSESSYIPFIMAGQLSLLYYAYSLNY